MKKLIVVLMIAFLCSVMPFVLAGCSDDNDTSPQTDTEISGTIDQGGANDTKPTDSGKWSPVVPLK